MADQLQTISGEKLCALTGLTDRRHRQLAKDGYFPPPLKGEYQLTATIQGMFKHYREAGERSRFPVFESIGSAASSLGCPEAMLKAAKRNGCAAFITGSRVDSGLLIPFLFSMVSKGSRLPDGFTSWRELLESEKAKRETIKRRQDEGDTMQFSEARRQASEAAALYFAELDRLVMECPPVLKGCDEVTIHKKLSERREEIRTQLNAAFEAIGKQGE